MIRFAPTVFQRLVLLISTFVAAWIGWQGLTQPESFVGAMEIEITGAGGRNEIMAQYGAYFVAVALALLVGAIGVLRTSTALIVLVLIYGGVFVGRIYVLMSDGWEVFSAYPTMLQNAHYIDPIGLLLCLAALAQGDRQRGQNGV